MDTAQALSFAMSQIQTLQGRVFDLVDITKPISLQSAANLARTISKLSPFLGNTIEFNVVELLNDMDVFKPYGHWIRQDPAFPDTIFQGRIDPPPGIEIKAWFPLATEITARFRDSQTYFTHANTYVALLAWLPEFVIYGRPYILNVRLIEAGSIARARDNHYHNPPDYLVIEPNDTRDRAGNLQQTNTMGYKWQDTDEAFIVAKRLVESWGDDGAHYKSDLDYQALVRELLSRFSYRLDTNYAKIDRIGHPEVEAFKEETLALIIHGLPVEQWAKICSNPLETLQNREIFKTHLTITESDATTLLK